MRYVIDAVFILWAAFGAVEIVLFLASAFIPSTEFEWDEEDERLL